jgi:hypothetical protein
VIHSSLGASFPQDARRGWAGFPRGTRRRGPLGTKSRFAKGGFAFVRWIFQHIPDRLVIPVLLSCPRSHTDLMKAATYLIDRAPILTYPGIHLLHDASFLKEDFKASFSTAFLLLHVAVAVRSIAENAYAPHFGGMPFASTTAFEKFGPLVFSNHSLDEAPNN